MIATKPILIETMGVNGGCILIIVELSKCRTCENKQEKLLDPVLCGSVLGANWNKDGCKPRRACASASTVLVMDLKGHVALSRSTAFVYTSLVKY